MEEKKFAFESEEVSVAFIVTNGLGDCIMAKKVFDAIVELEPNCVVDVFCVEHINKVFIESFYTDSKNLNRIIALDEKSQDIFSKYDLALSVAGSAAVLLNWVNVQRLQEMSPALLKSVIEIDKYNQKNPKPAMLRNLTISRILNKNWTWFLSCGGALPIHDDKITVPLLPEFQSQFDALKLDRYITVYSDINRFTGVAKAKSWPIRYLVEYISRMKKRLPHIQIVQVGRGDAVVENADRHFMECNLELTKYILANSLLHVGCEGGLIHLATALGTKCVTLFGFTSSHYYAYLRNINLVSDVCYPCACVLSDASADYRACVLGAKEPPCMLSLTPQLVCEVTCNWLKNNA